MPSTYSVLELIKKNLLGGVDQTVEDSNGVSHIIKNVGIDWKYLGSEFKLTADP